jgi:hypothetical protein
MDYESFKGDISQVIKELGSEITLTKQSGSKVKALAVEGKKQKYDSTGPTTFVKARFIIDGAIEKTPEVGDKITKGKVDFIITDVEAYQPADTVIAWRVSVQ